MIRREYPDRPIVGVLAVVRREDRLLIVRRGAEPSAGRWGFPGGAQELGETVAAAAIRELAEETGVAAEARAPLPAFDVIRRDGGDRIQHHYTLVPIVCDWRSGEGALSDEVAALRWLAADGLARCGLDLLPDVERLARLALAWRDA